VISWQGIFTDNSLKAFMGSTLLLSAVSWPVRLGWIGFGTLWHFVYQYQPTLPPTRWQCGFFVVMTPRGGRLRADFHPELRANVLSSL